MNLDKCLTDLSCKVGVLDDMLDCPVCFERLSGNVPQCIQGHHLCRKCRSRVSQCPVCKCKFNGTRNYLVESIVTQVEEIKYSLTNLSISKNVLLANKKNTGLSVIGAGKFFCKVGNCHRLLSYCDMLHHINKAHEDYFTDAGPIISNTYTHLQTLQHDPNTFWDEVLYIHNMGIFFITIHISHRGNVYGHVEIANNPSNAQYFSYVIEMGNNEYVESFYGKVTSTKDIHNKSCYKNIDDLLWTEHNKDFFNYTVTITYNP